MILLNESGSLWRNWDCICYCWEKKVKHLILICMPATHSFEFLFMFRSFHSSCLFEENNKTQLSHKMWVSTTSFFNSSLHHRLLIFFLLFPFSIFFLFTFDAHESEFFKHFYVCITVDYIFQMPMNSYRLMHLSGNQLRSQLIDNPLWSNFCPEVS